MWAYRRIGVGALLYDERVVGNATDGIRLRQAYGATGSMRLMGLIFYARLLAPRSHPISAIGCISPIRFSYPAVSIALTRVPPLPTPKRPHAVTSS